MAILWKKVVGSTRYEVRTAGRSRRLYTNGVFHSQYNSSRPVTGSVWDLLMLPAFFNPTAISRILVLGVGGGAVIRQLNHFLAPKEIIGVELNPVHLMVARRFFNVAASNVVLHCEDALQWIKHYRGKGFDMVIDDLFTDDNGDPKRVVSADREWFRQMDKLLSPQGVLVANFGSKKELNQCGWFTDATINDTYPSAYQLVTPLYENAIGAFLRQPSSASQLHQHLQLFLELDERRKSCHLNYQLRKLSARIGT